MPIPAETMRFLLLACLAGMALLALFYLRRRQLPFWAYVAWGLLALLLPLVGPFLVIFYHAGERRKIARR